MFAVCNITRVMPWPFFSISIYLLVLTPSGSWCLCWTALYCFTWYLCAAIFPNPFYAPWGFLFMISLFMAGTYELHPTIFIGFLLPTTIRKSVFWAAPSSRFPVTYQIISSLTVTILQWNRPSYLLLCWLIGHKNFHGLGITVAL